MPGKTQKSTGSETGKPAWFKTKIDEQAAEIERLKELVASGAPLSAAATPKAGATGNYEYRRRSFKRPNDGMHYVLVEKNPTKDADGQHHYQGDKLYDDGYEHCPDLGNRLFDVYRIPNKIRDERRAETGRKSREETTRIKAEMNLPGARISKDSTTEKNWQVSYDPESEEKLKVTGPDIEAGRALSAAESIDSDDPNT